MEAGKSKDSDVNDKEKTDKEGPGKAEGNKETSRTAKAEKEEVNKANSEKEGPKKEGGVKEGAQKENVEKNGFENDDEEIDIYIFSNGQMYSPPRKYHLRADELKHWESTLSSLARSQYGSMHSAIELHELDGRKVEDAKHIRDCAVYVAVVPPDPFIYAGYDKYLVKASRSYERRMNKKANGGEPSSQDDTNKDVANFQRRSTPITINNTEVRPQYPSYRNSEVRKSSLKNSSQKFTDKIKPVANQVSQRPHVPRKSNLKLSEPVTKKFKSRWDAPRNLIPESPSMSTQPGIPGKNSSVNQTFKKAKSPVKSSSFECDHSSHKVNESRQKLVDAILSSNINNMKTQNAINKVNAPILHKTIKSYNSDIKKINDTKKITVDETKNESAKHPKVSLNKIRTLPVKDLPKATINSKGPISANNKIPTLKIDDKSHHPDQASVNNILKPLTIEKTTGPPVAPVTIITNSRASMAEHISDTTFKDSTLVTNRTENNNKIIGSNNRQKTADKDETTEFTPKDCVSSDTENKIYRIEEISILKDNHNVKNNIDQVPKSMLEVIITPTIQNTVPSKAKASIVDEINEPKSNDLFILMNKTRALKSNEMELTAKLEPNIIISEEPPRSNNKELILVIDNPTIPTLKLDPNLHSLSHKIITSDEESERNNKNSTSQKASSQDTISKTIDKDISKTNITKKKSQDQSIKSVDSDNKIRVSTVEVSPVAQYIDAVVSNKSKENINTTSPNVKNKLNNTTRSESENVYDIKIPMLYHVPEKTLNYIRNNGTEVIRNNDVIKNNAVLSGTVQRLGDSIDIIIKSEDPNSNNKQSFTFFIKKDYDDNTIEVTDIKSNPRDIQNSETVPVSNIIKNKDFVHINVFRNAIDEATMTNKNGPPQRVEKPTNQNIDSIPKKDDHHDDTLNDKDKTTTHSSRNNDLSESKRMSKDSEMTTTFINPKWDGTSTSIVHKTSAPTITEKTETDANQFVELLQSGDIVSLKLSIQVRNADGILKSTHVINLGKSNSETQLENDEISNTPNELTWSKSLQSVENDSSPHLCCQKDKVIVYQCACCTQSFGENANPSFAANPLKSGLQGFYVLLPVAMPVTESARPPSLTLDKQVQHTESLITTNITRKETLITVPGSGDKQIEGGEKTDSSTKRQVAIAEEEIMHSELIMMRTEPSQTSSRYNVDSKLQQTSKTSHNQSTQTDWCDVLLEARAEPDGHFTFYLPPLHLLQQYTLR